ncbi:putative polyketide hydroxylase/tetracenomycin A2 monooxygenase-dioxygenase [Leucobacter luti]|uniref:Putative polyketide hydroxylase/tetracenomycin A2 monooxygenase-dioxygenase n=1 Tax=Leucobacter luti TaxID=340320 RepID=A0A4R6S3N8_9MICO|nr:FAD-dependent monooxygenase [Leucobacter luti]TDP94329.1 putative polyketide hydroxylase/tetracenomycin A2 monooxygenase-dioxygenase [Leucobacter luti]
MTELMIARDAELAGGAAEPDVAIVGAGPIGLTLALLLRAHGCSVVVLERHEGLSTHPKARGISARSMETFRGLGLEPQIRAAGLPPEHVRFSRGDTLADPASTVGAVPPTRRSAHTPSPGVLCSQDALESVLFDAAREAGVEVRFDSRVTEVTQAPAGVSLAIERATAAQAPVRARYVVGCDGAGSTVRRAAGIALQGERDLARFLSIRFRAELGETVRGREAASYFLTGGKGGFLAIDNDTRWVYQYPLPAGNDGAALQADPGALTSLVRAAAGLPELAVQVQDSMVWRMDARIADTYRNGRILLAGDAAHQTPPTGGHGMNVGIGDAETLSWQLAAVLRGDADEVLLDKYTAERRPVGAEVIAISSGNYGARYGIDDELLLGTHLGVTPPLNADPYAPSGAIGRRIPHVALTGDPAAASTLDLVRHRWLVLIDRHDPAWHAAAAASAAVDGRASVPVVPVTSGARCEVEPGSFTTRAGLAHGEGLLVRPDGHIAARLAGPAALDTIAERVV